MAHIIFTADYDKKSHIKHNVKKEIILDHTDAKSHSFNASASHANQVIFTPIWEETKNQPI
ncbi:hypothetical protein [Motilimonas pumila]|uniref:Uncharacterized protein n=1 Tax=Motilimonas pumila TaxID=2303987 RepID=A0A418YBN8_9GAMM|nr:hypothetical protein [Motilimonas pumila]RJG41930.1 hypothetical protein D1Z90_15675 [Motilimonas pumila]